MKLIKPPSNELFMTIPSIFLAGSIELGSAEKWQDPISQEFAHLNVAVYNPRRDDWDSSWVQSIENVQFCEQVEWELTRLELCDAIPMYFDPNTKSAITLLELGLFAKSGKLIVYCPEGFWRKGNVDVVCKRYEISRASSMEELVEKTITKLKDERPCFTSMVSN
jgi:hypothetical protein